MHINGLSPLNLNSNFQERMVLLVDVNLSIADFALLIKSCGASNEI